MVEGLKGNINTFPDNAEQVVNMREEMERTRKNIHMKKERFMHRHFTLFTRMEQAPNPDSRITLDRERDALGVPRVTLDWKLTPLDKQSIRKFHETIGVEAGRSDVGRMKLIDWVQTQDDHEWPHNLSGGWHHIGTTRMSEDPKKGVVDKHCRVHGLNNLFMAGSSCFPTSGSANPTLTIIALTLRLSDHLMSLDFNNT